MNPNTAPLNLSPRDRYRTDLREGEIDADVGQAAVIDELELIFDVLNRTHREREESILERVRGWFGNEQNRWPYVKGLYMWGTVGRGKTYLMDTFFSCLPFAEKRRIHFHSFMRRVHIALKDLDKTTDPLSIVAAEWASEHRVLCLDEFHVADITDAMLLANLLETLIAHGVTIIATSNDAPDKLYHNGLQRQRFLPAIELIKDKLKVVEIASGEDHRLRALEQAAIYYQSSAADTDPAMRQRFERLCSAREEMLSSVEIEGRQIPAVQAADGVAWFTFEALCGGPRSTLDYIELARCHHTLFISDIPVLDQEHNDEARRFINLIDELYDRKVNLVASAAAEPEQLYCGQRLAAPFRRTVSRLKEMQSHAYLASSHVGD
ncbi:MAG: cell division protein ZapE [Pseudomonadota bacterium]